MPYNASPQPTSGNGVFGSVPNAVALPQPYQAFGQVFPGTQSNQTAASSDILHELSGQLSPETLASIQNQDAAWGVASGMPGSGVEQNKELLDVANASQAQQQQGASNYKGIVSPSSQYFTVAPSVEAEIAEANAVANAAPNPTLAGLTNIGSHIAGLGLGYAMNNLGGGNLYQSGAVSPPPVDYGADLPPDMG